MWKAHARTCLGVSGAGCDELPDRGDVCQADEAATSFQAPSLVEDVPLIGGLANLILLALLCYFAKWPLL